MGRWTIAFLAVAPAVSAGAEPTPAKASEVWLCAGDGVTELLREGAEWPFVKQNLSGLKLYVDQIDRASPERLAALVKLVEDQHYQVAVECGCCLDFGPMDDTNGEWSAQLELAKIGKWYAAGGKVDFLDLDGHWLLKHDPFDGAPRAQGVIALSKRPGLGVVPAEEA